MKTLPVAGLRPGFGRGGMTHSFLVTIPGVAGPEAVTSATIFDAFAVLIARAGGAGASVEGEPAEDGVETEGDAILARQTLRFDADGESLVNWKYND